MSISDFTFFISANFSIFDTSPKTQIMEHSDIDAGKNELQFMILYDS